MAVSQLYTAVANDVITAARWNNEFGNIYNNGTSIAFPLTKAVSLAGYTLTLDAAGTTLITSTISQALAYQPGLKTGTPGQGVNEGSALKIDGFTFTDTATAGSGTAAEFSSVSIGQATLAATNSSVTTTDATTFYIAGPPVASTNETITNPWSMWIDDGAVRFDGSITTNAANHKGTLLFSKPIGGITWSRDVGDVSNDILVAIGETVSSDAALVDRRQMVLSTAIIGQVDTGTWVVGTNQPKLDTGSVANVPYYIWLIMTAAGVVDILFSASGTAPTMPATYSYKRLIGWFNRVAGVNLAFTVTELPGGGVHYLYATPLADVALAATVTTSRRTDALSVPLAFSVEAHIRVLSDDASVHRVLVGCPDETDVAVSTTTTPGFNVGTQTAGAPTGTELFIRTSSTGTVYTIATLTVDAFDIITCGFKWSRR